MSQPSLLFFHLLADRALNPGAIELCTGAGNLGALSPLIESNDFSRLCTSFPCFYSAELVENAVPELMQALEKAGANPLQARLAYHSDEPSKPVLPASIKWLSGNWYLAQPGKPSAAQSASHALSLKLLQKVAADADTCEIEAIFREEPVLAYHLLRLVNSLGIGVGRHISSFSQAILILGRQQLKRWLNLMLFAANRNDYRSSMLLAHVSARSRSMELLAEAAGSDRTVQEQAFMVGMFSLLDTLFGMPLDDILKPLKLNDALNNAILYRQGDLGELLKAACFAEQSNDSGLTEQLNKLNLTNAQFNQISLEAHLWTLDVIHDKQEVTDA